MRAAVSTGSRPRAESKGDQRGLSRERRIVAVLPPVRIVHFSDDFDRSSGSGGFPTAEEPSADCIWAVGQPPLLRLRLPRGESSGLVARPITFVTCSCERQRVDHRRAPLAGARRYLSRYFAVGTLAPPPRYLPPTIVFPAKRAPTGIRSVPSTVVPSTYAQK